MSVRLREDPGAYQFQTAIPSLRERSSVRTRIDRCVATFSRNSEGAKTRKISESIARAAPSRSAESSDSPCRRN